MMTGEKYAALIARNAHAGQFRKGNGAPYFAHCETVAQLVREYGGDTIAVQAAYLHDVAEDTDYTLWKIEQNFGIEVADIVAALTHTDGGWRISREAYAHRVRMARDRRVALVSAADKVSNAEDLIALGEERWKLTGMSRESTIWWYRLISDAQAFALGQEHPLVVRLRRAIDVLSEPERRTGSAEQSSVA